MCFYHFAPSMAHRRSPTETVERPQVTAHKITFKIASGSLLEAFCCVFHGWNNCLFGSLF
jgi:hypothetical protein